MRTQVLCVVSQHHWFSLFARMLAALEDCSPRKY